VKFARADIFLEYSASKEAKSLSADQDIRSFHGIQRWTATFRTARQSYLS